MFFEQPFTGQSGRLFLLGYREYVACGNDQEKNRTDLRHLTHPLSGERHRHGIAPAQGRFILNITYIPSLMDGASFLIAQGRFILNITYIGKNSKHIFYKEDLSSEAA